MRIIRRHEELLSFSTFEGTVPANLKQENNMRLHFWKMHGAGNDFILFDDRACSFPLHDTAWLVQLAARRTGIGCEGIILIQPSEHADFRMRFINPDGAEVEMCGNGARCVAKLAHDIGAAPARMRIETVAGPLRAHIEDGKVRLHMSDPGPLQMNLHIDLDGQTQICHTVNTGVPHVVIEMDDVTTADVGRTGSGIRYHAQFQPAGTNVNFVAVTGPQSIAVRTYERGVEDETMACGTGMVACALIEMAQGHVRSPVEVRPASGDLLEVTAELTGDSARLVTLYGPAEYVFEGELNDKEPV